MLWIWSQVQYSQQFIFFNTYDFAQQAKVLHTVRLEMLAKDKHSSLFISYKENKVLWKQSLVANPIKKFWTFS